MLRILTLALCASALVTGPALAGYCPIYVAADKATFELGKPVDTNVTLTDAKGKETVCDADRMTATTPATWDMPILCPKGQPETVKLDMPDADKWPSHVMFRDVEYKANC